MSYYHLKKLFTRLSHLQYVERVLMWDESVMMPEGSGPYRADALATLNQSIKKQFFNAKTVKLLDSAKNQKDLATWDKANLKLMKTIVQRSTCISSKLTEEVTKANLTCTQLWRKLRPKNDWLGILPFLQKSFDLKKEIALRRADVIGLSPYDTLIDEFLPGFNQAKIDPIFNSLKQTLPTVIKKIIKKQEKDEVILPQGTFSIEKQKDFGLKIMSALGFNFNQGRLDVSVHPFCSGGPEDVRITTRYNQNEFLRSLYAICHETGHALYEQGLPRAWIDQPVGMVESMAQHESQSLLIEMDVGRSLAFCDFLTPKLQEQFGQQPAFTSKNIYQLITRVESSLIRVDADEVTYPLHVILRYELEKALFNNEISVQDLPNSWNDLMTQYLGLSTKGNDQQGVMQDVHWFSGEYGYFPAYTVGRLIAAQLFASFRNAFPAYEKEIREGNFQSLLNWLRQNIYSHASSMSTEDLLLKATGKKLTTDYFLKHVAERYLTS